jgi:hypothetical protein
VNPPSESRRYQAYLLRLWQASEGEAVMWRALLEDPRTGERRGFADLDSLFAFLLATCREGRSDDEAIRTTL